MQDPRLLVESPADPMSSERRTHDIVLALYNTMNRLRNIPERSPRPTRSNACLESFFGDFDKVASDVILLRAHAV